VIVEPSAWSSITFTDPAAVVTVRTAIERRALIWIVLELSTATAGPGAGSAVRVGTGDGVGLAVGLGLAEADGLGAGVPDGVELGVGVGPGAPVGVGVGWGVGAGVGVAVGAVEGVALGAGVAASGCAWLVGDGVGWCQHHQNQMGQGSAMPTPAAGWTAANAFCVMSPQVTATTAAAVHRANDERLIDLSLIVAPPTPGADGGTGVCYTSRWLVTCAGAGAGRS